MLLHAVTRSSKNPSMMLGKVLLLIENRLLAKYAGSPEISAKSMRWNPEKRLNRNRASYTSSKGGAGFSLPWFEVPRFGDFRAGAFLMRSR